VLARCQFEHRKSIRREPPGGRKRRQRRIGEAAAVWRIEEHNGAS